MCKTFFLNKYDSMWFIALNILPFSHFLGWNLQTSLGNFFQFMADGQWPQDMKGTAVPRPFCTFLPCSRIPTSSLPKYLYPFLFIATPITREKGTNSLSSYGLPYISSHFEVPSPVQASSQAHSIELSVEPKLGETQEEKCKMCRFCQVPHQAALLYPEPRPYNLTSVFVHAWPTF